MDERTAELINQLRNTAQNGREINSRPLGFEYLPGNYLAFPGTKLYGKNPEFPAGIQSADGSPAGALDRGGRHAQETQSLREFFSRLFGQR